MPRRCQYPGGYDHLVSALVWASAALLPLGCATERTLMPTPLLYQDLVPEIFLRELPTERRRPDVDLLFITDRAPSTEAATGLPYGQERAKALNFGRTAVRIGDNLQWTELAQQSYSPDLTKKIPLALGETTELGQFPNEPYAVVIDGPRIRRAPEAEHLVPNWAVLRGTDAEENGFRLTTYASPNNRALMLPASPVPELPPRGACTPRGSLASGAGLPLQVAALRSDRLRGRTDRCVWPSFFTSNPIVSSDLLQLVRFGKRPGDPGRPLRQVGPVT